LNSVSKYSQLVKKSKSLNAVFEAVVEQLIEEVALAGATPFDLDEVGG